MAAELSSERDRGSDIYLLLGLLRATPPSARVKRIFAATLFCGAGKFLGGAAKRATISMLKVTCKCLSASASGPIFFSFQCYWLSEEIRTKEYNILCVADRKFFRHAVLEILVGSKTFMVN